MVFTHAQQLLESVGRSRSLRLRGALIEAMKVSRHQQNGIPVVKAQRKRFDEFSVMTHPLRAGSCFRKRSLTRWFSPCRGG
jgi:hypothetical protein